MKVCSDITAKLCQNYYSTEHSYVRWVAGDGSGSLHVYSLKRKKITELRIQKETHVFPSLIRCVSCFLGSLTMSRQPQGHCWNNSDIFYFKKSVMRSSSVGIKAFRNSKLVDHLVNYFHVLIIHSFMKLSEVVVKVNAGKFPIPGFTHPSLWMFLGNKVYFCFSRIGWDLGFSLLSTKNSPGLLFI